MAHETRMWQVYRLEGTEVTVIQQWTDPFGTPMLRFGIMLDGEVVAAGMSEAEFLAAAVFLHDNGAELVEGAR